MIRDKYYSDQKDSYTREEFSKVFDRICQKYRERKFTFKRNTMTKLPPHLEDQVFIKQLMDVEDISLEDDPLIVEYTMENLIISIVLELQLKMMMFRKKKLKTSELML